MKRNRPTPVDPRPRKATGRVRVAVSPGLERPNVDDPLSEPTRHRRVWAAYLAAGFTRRDFADRMGTNYHTVNRWDAGAAAMSLDMLERASRLLGYSMDELCFGHAARRTPAPAPAATEQALSEHEVRAVLDAMAATPPTRAAFGEHMASPAGRYQTLTASYVQAWCAAFERTHNPRMALQAAVNTRAVTEATQTGPVLERDVDAALNRRQQ